MYTKGEKIQYVHNTIIVLRTQVKIAKESKQIGNTEMYNTTMSILRNELDFVNLIGIVDYKNTKLLQQIINKMLESNT